jgi:hypothetical protein
MMALVPLYKEIPESHLPFSLCHVQTQGKDGCLLVQKKFLTGVKSSSTLTLDFQPPELCEKSVCL